MEFLATTWWIWLLIGIGIDLIAGIVLLVAFFSKSFVKGIVIVWLIGAISFIPWTLFIVGAIAALIGYAKN